jgi:hypothetical protein
MKWRSVLAAAAAVVVLAAPAPAQTVQDALKVVPREALGFAVVNNLSQASGRVVEVAERLQVPLPFGAPLEAAKKMLGIHKGLNDQGAALLAVLPGRNENAQPIALAYLPVRDYKALLREIKAQGDGDVAEVQFPDGKTGVIAHKGDFAVVTEAKHRKALERALTSEGGAAGLANLEKWLARNQVSGVVTAKGLEILSNKAREGLEQAKQNLGGAPPEAAEMFGDVLDGTLNFFKAVKSDVRAAGWGVRVNKGGDVRLSARALFVKGSGFARAAGKVRVPEDGPLAGLPGRPFALALGGSLPEPAMRRLLRFSLQGMKLLLKDAPDETKQKLEAAYADMGKGLRGIGMLVAVPREEEAIFGGIVGVAHVDNAEEYLKRQEKSGRLVSEALKGVDLPFGGKPVVKRIRVAGRPALETVTDMSGNPQGQILERLFGSADKITATAVAVDDHTIVTVYATPEKAKKLIQATKAKGGLAARAGVVKVGARLPKGAQWVGYISPRGSITWVKRIVAILPLPQEPNIPEMAKSEPVGMAVRVTAGGMEGELLVPAPALEAVARFVREVRKQQGGGQ